MWKSKGCLLSVWEICSCLRTGRFLEDRSQHEGPYRTLKFLYSQRVQCIDDWVVSRTADIGKRLTYRQIVTIFQRAKGQFSLRSAYGMWNTEGKSKERFPSVWETCNFRKTERFLESSVTEIFCNMAGHIARWNLVFLTLNTSTIKSQIKLPRRGKVWHAQRRSACI